jgi:hypothetical protein
LLPDADNFNACVNYSPVVVGKIFWKPISPPTGPDFAWIDGFASLERLAGRERAKTANARKFPAFSSVFSGRLYAQTPKRASVAATRTVAIVEFVAFPAPPTPARAEVPSEKRGGGGGKARIERSLR